MLDEANLRALRLHFEGVLTRDHTLPAPALVQSLQQFQRIVHLLAMETEGREVRQRARLTHDIERRFPLLCGVPEEGGYALPVEIGDPTHQLFDEAVVTAVATKTHGVISAVNAGDAGKLLQLVPDRYYRQNVIKAFQAMQPPPRSGLVVHIEDFQRRRLLDGTTAPERLTALATRRTPDIAATPAYITGALAKMEFQERRLRLQLLGTGRALEATYSDDFEPILLEHPRELIQIHGNVVYGDDGLPASISDVDEILEVDDSVIEVATITVDDLELRPRRPLTFMVKFDKDTQLYEAEGPFGISLGAITRPDLEGQLDAELVMLWREYAEANPASLTPAAQTLRNELLTTFSGGS